ncbi:MAG: tRNA guanosine(34) transglycosylase Tgt [Candidatus Moraniibacteriota bacterium]|nr:MAG: tRNA guanosine(34) transglycosylase Tgt [Candidatus Moranbacteria bacterium]
MKEGEDTSINEEEKKLRFVSVSTKNGTLETPFFMPDATRATVRGLMSEDIRQAGIEALVVNTYHLLLQPGCDRVEHLGGIHSFMKWKGPILSDSGGYQVYSLIHKNSGLGKVTEDGVEFRSPLNGSKFFLTPEKSIALQFELGVDMMVCLDDPRPNEAPREEIEKAVERSIRWALRCKEEYEKQCRLRALENDKIPLLFGVIQGGPYRDLRKKNVEGIQEFDFDGYGFGARHIDEQGNFLSDIISYTASILPQDKLRFALGVGTPLDIIRCFLAGWDMFDCVIPTREGRHGRIFFFKKEEINLNEPTKIDSSWYDTFSVMNKKYQDDTQPLEEGCDCHTCLSRYSRGYIQHLFRAQEMLGPKLATIHNLRFFSRLMEKLRKKKTEKD